jgi:hypothetical protein
MSLLAWKSFHSTALGMLVASHFNVNIVNVYISHILFFIIISIVTSKLITAGLYYVSKRTKPIKILKLKIPMSLFYDEKGCYRLFLRKLANIYTRILAILTFPFISLFDLCSVTLRCETILSESLIKQVKEKYKRQFNRTEDDINVLDTDIFWMPFLHCIHRNPCSRNLLCTYIKVYSFSRNTSCAFFMLALLAYACKKVFGNTGYFTDVFFTTCLILSLIFLLRYYYVFTSWYTKTTFRLFAMSDDCLSPLGEKNLDKSLSHSAEPGKTSPSPS